MTKHAQNPGEGRRRPGPPRRRGKALRTSLAVVLLIIAASLGYGLLAEGKRAGSDEAVPTAEVKRGDLTVTVEERGAIYSMKPLEVQSEVEGRNMLLEIVDEGTILTQEDVDEGRIIIKLDSSSLEETISDWRIEVFQAEAAYVQAKENHDIQLKQNESNIAAAELNLRFARMDAARYLGAELAAQLLRQGIESVDLGAMARAAAERMLEAESGEEASLPPGQAAAGQLGGEARQRLRTLTARAQLAAKELTRAEEQLTWSQRLAEKKYISANELVRDKIAAQRRRVQLSAAEEELELFLRYTLQKDAQQLLSDCVESQRDLERVQARVRSQLAQSEANLRSREASYNLEAERLKKSETMLANCTIRAPRPGRVAYGSSAGGSWGRRGRGQVNIELGAAIPENQVIVRIPDMSALSVKVNVSEKDIDKVKVGQPAIITIEATPGKTLPGQVVRISPMASSTQAWLNPDTKVYETEVAVRAVPEMFIPGMSANVRIVVAQLKDVVHMPIQAVIKEQGYSVCWVKGADRPVPRRIEAGLSTGTRVQIKSGVRPGEWVYLAPPDEASLEELAVLIEEAKKLAPAEEPEPLGLQVQPPGLPPRDEPPAHTGEQPAGEQVDWRAEMQNLRGLSEEEREKKLQELLQQMPAEQRQQYEERRRQRESMSPEDRERMRQQRSGQGEGAPRQQPSRPTEQGSGTDGTR